MWHDHWTIDGGHVTLDRAEGREHFPAVSLARGSEVTLFTATAMLAAMIPDPAALDAILTPADAGRTFPSFGPDWDLAVATGIDVSLLLENLALSASERLRRLDEQNRLAVDIQRRTVSPTVRQAIASRSIREKAGTLGLADACERD